MLNACLPHARWFWCGSLLLILSLTGAVNGQDEYEGGFEPGVIARGAPFDLFLEVTTGPDGEPVLSRDQFLLAQGGYYRLNFVCPDVTPDHSGFHFEATRLVADSHIRVLSVGQVDVEFYMQGLTFRAIQCDEAGSGRFSFFPMRTGVYELRVNNIGDPSQEASAVVIVE